MADLRITERCSIEDIPRLPRNIQRGLIRKLSQLQEKPEWGKILRGDLQGYQSLPLSRYRIIYRYDGASDMIIVLAVGIRKEGSSKDIYQSLIRLIKKGKLES